MNGGRTVPKIEIIDQKNFGGPSSSSSYTINPNNLIIHQEQQHQRPSGGYKLENQNIQVSRYLQQVMCNILNIIFVCIPGNSIGYIDVCQFVYDHTVQWHHTNIS